MQVTRQFWSIAAVGMVLVAAAATFARPLLLVGAAGVGAWFLAVQIYFVYTLRRTETTLSVEQSVALQRVSTDELTEVTLRLERSEWPELPLRAELQPPIAVSVDEDDRSVTLPPGDENGYTTVTVRASIAGSFEFPPAAITARDPFGLFTERFARGTTPTLEVEPRAPQNVHVGQGGDNVAVAYGEHDAGRLGSGFEPAELREYLPGDDASRIDWKATARLNHPHVREFEAETDRTTALVVDHRASMRTGREGQTKLDYIREVALGFQASARDLNDPLGLNAVGDDGVTVRANPAATTDQYDRVRSALYDLAPTETPDRVDTFGVEERSPADARGSAAVLDDNSAFGRTLAPFLADARTYVERVSDDPLFSAVDTHLAQLRGSVWTVLFTDDEHRAEVREAVKAARRGEDHVLVFLTPTVLFDADGLADLDRAYDRYREFERFRRQLDRLERVTAFEVAPGDRLRAVLAARQDRRVARGDD